MKLHSALCVLEGLADARGRYPKPIYAYGRKLLTPKDKVWFDDKIAQIIIDYSRDYASCIVDVEKILDDLRKLGFARSKYKYAPMEDAILRFQQDGCVYNAKKKYIRRAIEKIKKEFSKVVFEVLEYHSIDDLLNNLPKAEAHPGWSGLILGIYSKKELIEKQGFKTWLKELETALEVGSFNKPIVMGYRTQAGTPFNEANVVKESYKEKVRLINIVDIWQVMAELMFAKAVQNYMSKQSWYAGGKDDDTLLVMINDAARRFNYSVTTDYSSYDQTISDWLIHEAFDIMEAGFKFKNDMHKRLFRIVREDFIHKVIFDANLRMREVHKGVPSGSMFTQIVDSIVNKIMIDAFMMSHGYEDRDYTCIIMGDDNIIFTYTKIDEKVMAKYLVDNFKVDVNPDKMDAAELWKGEHPEFLSRVWTPNGVYRNPFELLARICYPERRRNYKNKMMKPEYIIYGYILSFPLGMKELIDVRKFKQHFQPKQFTNMSKDELAVVVRELPGSIAYQLRYAA